jgi:hypothetical protein
VKRVRQLLSKLVAGGLTAAVILLWWPRFFPVDTAAAWLARGVIWTLGFELLLHALAPLEAVIWESTAARRVGHRAAAARSRLGGRSRAARVGSRGALACAALAVPALLLAVAPPPRHQPVRTAEVKHVTEVKRIVRVERRAAPGARAADHGLVSTTSAPASPALPAGRTVAVAPRRVSRTPVRKPTRRTQTPSQGQSQTPSTTDHGNSGSGKGNTTSGTSAPTAAPQQDSGSATARGSKIA